jgi:hypothetical protein
VQQVGKELRFSASDLVGHLDCHHLTALDAAVARGTATKPKIWDPVLETLAERGKAHEREYLEKLEQSGGCLLWRSRTTMTVVCGGYQLRRCKLVRWRIL